MSLEKLVRIVEKFLSEEDLRVRAVRDVIELTRGGTEYVDSVCVGREVAEPIADELRASKIMGLDLAETLARVLLTALATALPMELAERVLVELIRLAEERG